MLTFRPPVPNPRREARHINATLADGVDALPPVFACLSPADAQAAEVANGDLVRVTSEHGSITLPARILETVRAGVVSIPHGYAHGNVGLLTSGSAAIDPLTGMVLQSGLSVSIGPADR